jgi:hypothetical protein
MTDERTPRKPLAPIHVTAVSRGKTPGGAHWFDHPEMQARIARAEADFRDGHVQCGNSLEELLSQLDALKK